MPLAAFTKKINWAQEGNGNKLVVKKGHKTTESISYDDIFYHISSFMCDFEGFRWRWSHTFHHSCTLQTKNDYDHEIQVSRPTDLIAFFLNFIPFTDLLFPHRLIKYEVTKHAFGFFTPVIDITAPKNEKKKILWNSRLYVFIWVVIISLSLYYKTIFPIRFDNRYIHYLTRMPLLTVTHTTPLLLNCHGQIIN